MQRAVKSGKGKEEGFRGEGRVRKREREREREKRPVFDNSNKRGGAG